jgi:chitinase
MSKRISTLIICFFINLPLSALAGLTGYWQNFNNPAETPVRLTDIPAGYNIVTIAFADMAADGSASFTLQGPPYTYLPDAENTFKSDIKTLQNKGVKVLLSLGGQNGYYQLNSTQQQANLTTSLEQIIKTYNFDGLDYDFESGLTASNATYLADATQKIKQDFLAKGKLLYFTAAPESFDVYWQQFPYGKYDPLIRANLIDLVQVQLYNSGCMPGSKPGSLCYVQGSEDFIVSQADSTIQVWMQNGIQNAAAKYAIGLPASASAAGGGYVDPSIVKKALICLQTQTQCDSYRPTQAYPELRNVMTWSINWDAKNAYSFENTMAGKSHE